MVWECKGFKTKVSWERETGRKREKYVQQKKECLKWESQREWHKEREWDIETDVEIETEKKER